MRRHQVLTGAVNPGNHCFSAGSIASFTFWAYGSGCDLVILGVDLQPIHIIPGHVRGYQLITCLDCCQFCGKIAVSYGKEIVIYRPKLIENENENVPIFTWLEESILTLEGKYGQATVLSWASTGEKLLVGCNEILLWVMKKTAPKENHRPILKVQFSIEEIEEEDEEAGADSNPQQKDLDSEITWELAWNSGIQENPCNVQYSPDDLLFASISRGDSMLKVWHQRFALPLNFFREDSAAQHKSKDSPSHSHYETKLPPVSIDFTFTYLIHPKPVAGFQWRKGVPLLPSGSVPNILISSCHDNMCRIWCETLTPETDVTKLAATKTSTTTMNKPLTAKKKQSNRSEKHLGASLSVKKSVSAPVMAANADSVPDSKLSEKPSVRLFRHFHIAATINPTADIPLLPSMSSLNDCTDGDLDEGEGQDSLVFTVHWMDNKHHHAMAYLNKLLHETLLETKAEKHSSVSEEHDDEKSVHSHTSTSSSLLARNKSTLSPTKRPSGFPNQLPVWDSTKPESIDTYLSCLASPMSPDIQSDYGLSLPGNIYDVLGRNWTEQSDALFAIHPTDGSLLVWHVSYLDENRCGRIRQPQVSFSSRIPMAIPVRDASTLCPRLVLYANHYVEHLMSTGGDAINGVLQQKFQEPPSTEQLDQDFLASDGPTIPTICLLSKHSDGSLNHWEITFPANAAYSTISSLSHKARFCGHRYHLADIFCHPTLPLLLTTSRHRDPIVPEGSKRKSARVNSELILWRVDPVGALCHTGGVTELTRMNGFSIDDFSKVSWFPVLFPSWCLGTANTSPSTCFLSLHKSSIHIYQAIIDAEELLEGLESPMAASAHKEQKIGYIASRQSSSHPGCVILLEELLLGSTFNMTENEILLLTVIPEKQFSDGKSEEFQNAKSPSSTKKAHSILETFFVVLIYKKISGISSKIVTKTWKIVFSANLNAVGVKSHRSAAVAMSDSSDENSDVDSAADDTSGKQVQRLSYLNVTAVDLSLQEINHPNREEVTFVCAALDPLLQSVFRHTEPLPYTLLTASKQGNIYFWRCAKTQDVSGRTQDILWERVQDNAVGGKPEIEIKGTPLVVKVAHCCMLACLHEYEGSYFISVYECLSTGGSSWRLQNKILIEDAKPSGVNRVHLDWLSREDGTFLLTANVGRKIKIYAQAPIGMRWEDVLQVKVGDAKEKNKPAPTIRPLLKRQSTLDAVTRQKILRPYKSAADTDDGDKSHFEHLLHWSLLSEVSIGNSAGLSASYNAVDLEPVMVSWVRDGLLLVAMETEMHIFCHWIEQAKRKEEVLATSSGVLYGSASLSRSTPEGLCQYLLKEADGYNTLSAETPVVNMMSVADVLSPCLPQYHPLVLSELMNGGHLDMVKHILINLAVAINGQFEPPDGSIQGEPTQLKKYGLRIEENETENEGKCIAPLLLYDILDENGRINDKISPALPRTTDRPRTEPTGVRQAPTTRRKVEHNGYDDLFASTINEDDEDQLELIIDEKLNARSNEIIDLSQFEPGYLGSEHCQVLHNYLLHNLLPGLSCLNQMELLAIADTIANEGHSKMSMDRSSVSGIATDDSGRGYASSGNAVSESMDQCGLRFIFAMHNHLCLLRSLPAAQRTKLLLQGLESCHFAWAFHSDAEEEILSLISSVQRGAPEWNDLKSFGAGWWIRSNVTLRRLIEQTARAAFQKNSNPLDAAVFYMALNKKNVLKGLFKSVHEDRMTQFFSQDFKEDRWHRAALKNAFALMGKQRFQEAAAFFLLANSVEDAVEVCIEKMKDLQLASIIVRLYDQEKAATAHAAFLRKHVLGDAAKGGHMQPDPFLRSMAYWQLGLYEDSLKTLLDNEGTDVKTSKDVQINITDVFNFYNFLRSHPLIMRQKKIDQSQAVSGTDQEVDDRITMEERALFFATAATHLEAGCPLLTLDVLSSLPPLKCDSDVTDNGNINEVIVEEEEKASNLFDTNEPAKTNVETDWTVPSFDAGVKEELELEWSESDEGSGSESDTIGERPQVQHLTHPLKDLKEEKQAISSKIEPEKPKALHSDIFASQLRIMACLKIFVSELNSIAKSNLSDGGQIRELVYSWLEKETKVLHRISPQFQEQTLSVANTSKVDQQVEGDKPQKTDFSSDSESESDNRIKITFQKTDVESPATGTSQPPPSLHELYLAEKQDWKIRRETAFHRRRWLKEYRRFLRGMLSYCGLHDDARGSLSPLRMEILLLLQDSLQEKSPQQLSSPVLNPTTVPLLSSSVVACHTVVAGPTAQLSHMAQDIFESILVMTDPPPYFLNPGTQSPTIVLCRQAESLSACIYQALCDTNSKTYRARLLDKTSSPDLLRIPGLTTSASSISAQSRYMPPSTLPSQWPGVVSLQALLNSESSDNRPRLIVLLCESLIAVYISLLVHGMQTCNSLLLYRLVSNTLCEKTWNAVFGGGARLAVKYTKPPLAASPSGMDGDKVREKLTRKALSYSHERKASFTSFQSTDSTSYREKFVAPETTLWDIFLSKPLTGFSGAEEVDFESDSDKESDDSLSEEDDYDVFEDPKPEKKVTEHGNPDSYSWHILRVAIVRTILNNIKSFLPVTGLEISELGISSPLLNNILQLLGQWQVTLVKELEAFSAPPPDFIKGIQNIAASLQGRPAILKHQAMLDIKNTPFSGSSVEALGARRLWHCLVRKDSLQELFIRYIFHKKVTKEKTEPPEREDYEIPFGVIPSKGSHKKKNAKSKLFTRRATIAVLSPSGNSKGQPFFEDRGNGMGLFDGNIGKVRILHKEAEIVSSFCINNANPNCVVLSTSRDVQEVDISTILTCDTWSWVEEDLAPNLLQEDAQKQSSQKEEEFLVVSRKQSMFVTPTPSPLTHLSFPASASGAFAGSVQTGQGTTVLLKRSFSGVRRMTSHPTLPYYVTGHHDGSIRMWEWGHQQQITLFRAAGQFPKVTNLHFSSLGNKIAAVDADGYMALWQVSSPRKPFLYHHCHDRSATDCCFLSSTSILATTGMSSSNHNVAIWDTLLPPRSMLVKDFAAHEGVGATCVAYSAQSRTLLVGSHDGKISMYDLRKADQPLTNFTAHEAPVKCISLSPDDKLFATGSVVGDMRVWDSNSHLLVYNLAGEHARTSIFRNFGSGTMKVEIGSPGNRVFSCGADGTLKLRMLPHDQDYDFGLGRSFGNSFQKITLQKQVIKLANAIRQQCLVY